jgi:hypothetical protein
MVANSGTDNWVGDFGRSSDVRNAPAEQGNETGGAAVLQTNRVITVYRMRPGGGDFAGFCLISANQAPHRAERIALLCQAI